MNPKADAPTAARLSLHKRKRRKLYYSVDVLTDGSEWTGDGTLFLSVYKESPYDAEEESTKVTLSSQSERNDVEHVRDGEAQHQVDDNKTRSHVPPPLARYSMGSLTDVLSRLAFDQRFSLGATRAFFAVNSSNSSESCVCQGLEGLPPLLLNLKQAGAEQLTLVLRDEATMQAVQDTVPLILPSHRSQHPHVQLCSVPAAKVAGETNGPCWWNVHSDEYVVVHAKRFQQINNDSNESANETAVFVNSDTVLYLMTLLHHDEAARSASLVVVPGDMEAERLNESILQLPVLENGLGKSPTVEIRWGIAFGSTLPKLTTASTSAAAAHSVSLDDKISWYYTQPRPTNVLDPGLLVRAQQQSKTWHAGRPQYFPWNETTEIGDASCVRQSGMDIMTRLHTGWSLLLKSEKNACLLFDRMRQLKVITSSSLTDRSLWPLKCDFEMASSTSDDNEIELDDDECEVNDEKDRNDCKNSLMSTQLLVLGTGCAAPSPYRGSSGHCLFLSPDFTFVFEVGDGFLTQWSRYSSRSLLTIRAIWISHAHWDHYGGLAALLLKIFEVRQDVRREERQHCTSQGSRKRQRQESIDLPLVLACGKVLKYLEQYFGDTNNYFHGLNIARLSKQASELLCQLTTCDHIGAVTHPITFFDIVPMDHSCYDSFGFVIGLHCPTRLAPFVFCFSGDTRPCQRFVHVCRQRAALWNNGFVDLLLHEATFEESESEMSITKKHSTIKEAIEIGWSIRAGKIFLTHFSQRYAAPSDLDTDTIAWTPMFDGVLVPLFN
ncbi:hypothetical protein MPSEU_000406800 [Mayamaea pseudoterrestris]|nr:hypothetical protein MPSEU_000406800 [Mayamaea pseudoterrestris]